MPVIRVVLNITVYSHNLKLSRAVFVKECDWNTNHTIIVFGDIIGLAINSIIVVVFRIFISVIFFP